MDTMMSLQALGLFVCLVLVVVQCQVLDFTRQLTPDDIYCGHLRCVANSSQPIINIAIYDVTWKGNPVKLATISVFVPEAVVDPSKVNVIDVKGTISQYDGVLNVRFLGDVDCYYGAFQCQLHFVNINGQPDVVRENLAPATEENATMVYSLAKIATQLKEHSEDTDKQLGGLQHNNKILKADIGILKQDNDILKADIGILKQDNDVLKADIGILKQDNDVVKADIGILKQDNDVLKADIGILKQDNEVLKKDTGILKQDNEALKTVLDSILMTVSRIDGILNSTLDKKQHLGSSCYRGMAHKSPREKFVLQGKTLALCDTETDGGGWVIIQRRVRGDVDFYRGWDDYKRGFGTPDTDLWIGNDIIHNLTSQGYNELRIDFIHNKTKYFAQYTNFIVADESSAYAITIGGYSGNVYDAISNHNGNKFSTFDRDNDMWRGNCAQVWHGAWWYYSCFRSNLNGAWAASDQTGIVWYFNDTHFWRNLSFTEMKIREI